MPIRPPIEEAVIVVRGGGDLATGVIQKFHRAGARVLVLEIERPLAIRRTVALCEAIPRGTQRVEDMRARRVTTYAECAACWSCGDIPALVDPDADVVRAYRPDALIDATLAKRNLGTSIDLAPIVIALGPGFTAGVDCHAVVETQRGHRLGVVLYEGGAQPDTGIPGEIGGRSLDRVLRAPCSGTTRGVLPIGAIARAGDTVLTVGDEPVLAPFTGLVRGVIADGIRVRAGLKVGDVDPRIDSDYTAISDKARSVGGAALEAFLYLRRGGTRR